MRKELTILLLLTLFLIPAKSQEENKPKFGIKLSGFVKNDVFYDSRQTVNAREGHFLLWPSAESLDANGDDINASSSINMLAIQSRITGKITGPDAFGAKTSGVIEGDFFGQANDNINLFRMRHAFIKLNWTNTELISGQYWNPLFVTGCFPGTVSFNTGTPIQSFARNPQIRVTQTIGGLSIIGALLSQRDYVSRGPAGASSSYLRNSGMPDVHIQVHYSNDALLVGAGIASKKIVPRLVTDANYITDETVGSMAAIGFIKYTTKPLTIKLQGRYGENIPDVLAISGYAVKEVVDSTTNKLTYTPLKSTSFWADIHTNSKTLQFGVFAGIFNNLGTKEAMSDAGNTIYGLGTNIESLLRVSPRVILNSGKFRLAFELEYTQAEYGSGFDVNYQNPTTTKSVSNVRTLLSTYYFF